MLSSSGCLCPDRGEKVNQFLLEVPIVPGIDQLMLLQLHGPLGSVPSAS